MRENNSEFNSFGLVRFIWQWRVLLGIVCIGAAILSFVFSMPCFITPQFKSTAVVFAPRTNSVSKILTNEQNYNERLDIKAYAVDEETEQMMQILNSREMHDKLISIFNLSVHYDIDSTKKYWKTKLYKTVSDKVEIKRTEFGAIAITVTDHDSQFAADMANEVVRQLDTIKNRIEYERTLAAYNLLAEQVEEMNKEIRRVDDSLRVLGEKGVLMLEKQSDRLSQQYAIAVAQGNQAAMSRLEKEIEKVAIWGPTVLSLQNEQLEYSHFKALCKSKMLDAQMDMKNGMPVKFVIDQAVASDKKAYPKRSIIMILSTFGAFILALMVLLIIRNINEETIADSKQTNEA